MTQSLPLLLLKTRSTPTDAYQKYFGPSSGFTPTFLPVLTHYHNPSSLARISSLLQSSQSSPLTTEYDGLIFTSQRAVEAFSSCVHDTHSLLFPSSSDHSPHNDEEQEVIEYPLYVVGPATGAQLTPILAPLRDILNRSSSNSSNNSSSNRRQTFQPVVLGQDCGNGETLAKFMLREYNGDDDDDADEGGESARTTTTTTTTTTTASTTTKRKREWQPRRKLLFFVGEQRRDVIPRTLMDSAALGGELRTVQVEEMEVYRTDVRAEFEREFAEAVERLQQRGDAAGGAATARVAVIVVFSPQGCDTMLKVLGWSGGGGGGGGGTSRGVGVDEGEGDGRKEAVAAAPAAAKSFWVDESRSSDTVRYVVATIGPTTRDFLRNSFGFEPDACAKKPSPEGVALAVADFLREKGIR